MDTDSEVIERVELALVKAFQSLLGESFVRIPSLETAVNAAALANLKLTLELVDSAVNSISGDNYDESDIALTNAIRKIINLEKGLGPAPDSATWEWAIQTYGVAMSNAVGFASHIGSLLEDDDMADKRKKLMGVLYKAAFANAPDAVKAQMKETMDIVGNDTALLFVWALYNEGVTHGMFMGWRSHELAILGASAESPSQTDVEKN